MRSSKQANAELIHHLINHGYPSGLPVNNDENSLKIRCQPASGKVIQALRALLFLANGC
jgi:hypothetical protein